ncbi:transposase [Symbiopectobacterium purcellii]|uniref:transposase n=1 Tax=Symbiopectobacterium purcellii TaxID=2871826 RepID=UPI003F82CF7F
MLTKEDVNQTVKLFNKALGISNKTLHTWVSLAREQSNGVLSDDERAELKRLQKENKELRTEKEILKKASAFFAKHMS